MKTERKTIVVVLALLLMIETCALALRVAASSSVGFPSLVPYGFNDTASSLKVNGTVILYGDVDYGNGTITFADTSIPDLRACGWNDRASSLKVDGTVTLYEDINYGGRRINFTSDAIPYDDLGTEWNLNPSLIKSEGKWDSRVYDWGLSGTHIVPSDSSNYINWTSDGLVEGHSDNTPSFFNFKAEDFEQGFESEEQQPSYQPPLLRVADTTSLTLEGIVHNYGSDFVLFPGWSGVKFDVWAVENLGNGKKLMLEMYFLRTGLNLVWSHEYYRQTFPISSPNVWNYMVNVNTFPEYASRVIYDGDIVKWTIDVRAFIQRACNQKDLDINSLFISKVSFTLETGGILLPSTCWGSLNRLRLCYTTVPKADVSVASNGPDYIERDKQFNFTINYINAGSGTAVNVSVVDSLPPNSTFVSASNGGIYIPASKLSPFFFGTDRVIWSLGTMPPFSSGFVTVTVTTSPTTSFGTVLSNTVFIFTTSQESNSNNDQGTKSTVVSEDSSLPPNVDVGPTTSSYNHMPVLCWTTPTTFTYYGEANVTGVNINIHMLDGGPEIGGPMASVPGTHNWSFARTFYPRHGQAMVNYTVYYADGLQTTTAYGILVNPSGYVYDGETGERIQGATVTLLRFNTTSQKFVEVASDDPSIEPHTNPQTTDESGGYGWIASAATYMVEAEKKGYSPNFAMVSVLVDINIPLTALNIHDVAVVDVTPYRNWTYQESTVSINTTVANNGNFTETVTVKLYYNITSNELIGTQSVGVLPGKNETLTFLWSTAGVPPCYSGYNVTALADISPEFDSNMANNVLQSPANVTVRILGDVDGDARVYMRDIAPVARAFGSSWGDTRWNEACDVNNDGKIDLKDVALVAKHFGQHYQ